MADSIFLQQNRRWFLALVLILLLGATVRIVYLAQYCQTVLCQIPSGDELNFVQTAHALLHESAGLKALFFQPLYSFFLALVLQLFGDSLFAVRLLQLAIGVTNILIFYALGRQLSGRPCGIVAAAMAALYGPFVFFESQLLAPVLTVPLLALGILLLLQAQRSARPWLLAVSGICVGLVLMARPNLALLLPVVAVWWWLKHKKWQPRVGGLAAALLGICLGLAPSWIHNYQRGEGFVPVSASGGHSFYIGNYPEATGMYHVPLGLGIDGTSHQAYRNSWRAIAQREQGTQLSDSQVSSHWQKKGFQFWQQQPLDALYLLGKKIYYTLNAQEIPIHNAYFHFQDMFWALSYLFGFGLLMPLAILGFVVDRKKSPQKMLALCFVAAVLSTALFYAADRYRIVLLPMVIPLAASGMISLVASLRQPRLRSTAISVGTVVLAAALLWPPVLSQNMQTTARYRTYNRMGTLEGNRGQLAAAEGHFKKAIAVAGSQHATLALVNLGRVHQKRGQTQQAKALFLTAAKSTSEYPDPWVMLAKIAEAEGNLPQALEFWQQAAALSADKSIARRHQTRLQSLQPPQSQPQSQPNSLPQAQPNSLPQAQPNSLPQAQPNSQPAPPEPTKAKHRYR